MEVPFFVALSVLHLVGNHLPSWLPLNARAVLADTAASPPARAAKCAISAAVTGLALLVSMQCSGTASQQQCPAEVAMEARALWFNSAAMFLGALLAAAAVELHPLARVTPAIQVAVEHLTRVTETVAITALAHDLCIFLRILKA